MFYLHCLWRRDPRSLCWSCEHLPSTQSEDWTYPPKCTISVLPFLWSRYFRFISVQLRKRRCVLLTSLTAQQHEFTWLVQSWKGLDFYQLSWKVLEFGLGPWKGLDFSIRFWKVLQIHNHVQARHLSSVKLGYFAEENLAYPRCKNL